MQKLINWVKNNKLTTLLLIIVFYFLFKSVFGFTPMRLFNKRFSAQLGSDSINLPTAGSPESYAELGSSYGTAVSEKYMAPANPYPDSVDNTVTDRKMVTSTNLSLQVKSVGEVINNLKSKLTEFEGFIVNINILRPEVGETATVVFRVPTSRVDETLSFIKGYAIKVVSENVSGHDITDQFTDYEERLERAELTKLRLEEILDEAVKVDEILDVQQRIFNLQSEIDNYKGKLKYLEGASETSLITAYLSTDEAGLPYTEPLSWRPDVIFKHAVRSMIGTLQGLGSALIWLGVYSVLIVPAITIVIIISLISKKRRGKQEQSGS